jgi:hypothetical protein
MLEPNLFAFMERTADAAFAVTREGEICSWATLQNGSLDIRPRMR